MMRKGWRGISFFWVAVLLGGAAMAHAGEVVFVDEQFTSLDRWQPLAFAKIDRHSRYSAVTEDGRTCLLMESDNSASALVLKQSFNVYEYPKLSWRWKVSGIFRKGDSSRKEGDDYPARLYVMFAYTPEQASLGKRIKYQLAKTIYGQYPPDSSINYIWDNRSSKASVIINAYTDQARMIPVSAGAGKVNTWQEYTMDIVRDYRLAFGKNPPKTATLAVMNDSDDTGESAKAWIDFIKIYRVQ
jgi:hypothetical protein